MGNGGMKNLPGEWGRFIFIRGTILVYTDAGYIPTFNARSSISVLILIFCN